MRIQCSSCGSLVTIRKNENGEVNCPRCGVGLLELQSTRDADIDRYTNQPRGDELPGFTPRSILAPILLFGGFLLLVGLVAIGIIFLNR